MDRTERLGMVYEKIGNLLEKENVSYGDSIKLFQTLFIALLITQCESLEECLCNVNLFNKCTVYAATQSFDELKEHIRTKQSCKETSSAPE